MAKKFMGSVLQNITGLVLQGPEENHSAWSAVPPSADEH